MDNLVTTINPLAIDTVIAIIILLVIVRGAGFLGIRFFQQISENTVILKWLVGGDLNTAIYTIKHLTADDIRNIELQDLTTVDFESVGNQVEELINQSKFLDVIEKQIP